MPSPLPLDSGSDPYVDVTTRYHLFLGFVWFTSWASAMNGLDLTSPRHFHSRDPKRASDKAMRWAAKQYQNQGRTRHARRKP